jgi:cytochrome c
MKDRQNTINGWILGAAIVALGGSIVTGEVFHAERPETMGYPIEGVVEEGAEGAAAAPINFAAADPAAGEQVFKKCAACHNADPGGANALGPALYGVMGKPVASHAGFAFSDALKSKGGTWDWQTMSDWLASPRSFAPGTKMTFAGLSNPVDRANVIAFLNSRSASPLPVPPPPAETASADKAAAEAEDAGAQKAENEPVLNEGQAAKAPGKAIAGEGAPKVSGTDPTAKKN